MTLLSDFEGRLLSGRYKVESHIAKGGMGEVFKALDTHTGCYVAIKISTGLSLLKRSSPGSVLVSSLKKEEVALLRLNHPNIVRLLDVGEDEQCDLFFLVLEYIDGRELAKHISTDRALSVDRCVYIMLQVIEAVEASHEEGVIHLDLKPSNIIVDDNGNVKVVDFGLAKFIPEINDKDYHPGSIVGTPFYLSPEQVRESSDLDARSDVYNLGIILYELLTSMSPFDKSDSRNVVKFWRQRLRPFPKDLRVPKKVREVVWKSLSPFREDRYQTAKEMGVALSEAIKPFSFRKFIAEIWSRVRLWIHVLK